MKKEIGVTRSSLSSGCTRARDNFREKYNNLIMSFVKFFFVTRDLNKHRIDDHRVYQLLAPRLVNFRLSVEEKM